PWPDQKEQVRQDDIADNSHLMNSGNHQIVIREIHYLDQDSDGDRESYRRRHEHEPQKKSHQKEMLTSKPHCHRRQEEKAIRIVVKHLLRKPVDPVSQIVLL